MPWTGKLPYTLLKISSVSICTLPITGQKRIIIIIIGGHSAIGNFLTQLFGFLVHEPEVQQKIQEEIQSVVESDQCVSIYHRSQMVYTEAVIYETIRMISSPIVPRVANQDSSIGGKLFFYFITFWTHLQQISIKGCPVSTCKDDDFTKISLKKVSGFTAIDDQRFLFALNLI